ncbi:alpha/beta hydrolase [Paraburkholderia sediminicola]|uniref:Alpha/beta hydrolase n=1 Tax=Paraburkholderia metrosideri TaxID=580937 RepID=A0ABW9E319_9BURK
MNKMLAILAAALLWSGLPLSAAARPEPALHNIVLVHSALVDGSSWRDVYEKLVKDGYHVSIVAHTQSALSDDVAATRRVIEQQDGPVVLVGASYGGSIITEAGVDPKVRALVYVAAMQPDVGESLIDLASRMPSVSKNLRPDSHGFLSLDPKVFHADFCADVPAALAGFLAIGQMPLAVTAASAKTTVAAWHDKPAYGVIATQDRLINPDLQRFMYKRGNDTIVEVKASHGVFLSQPRVVAEVIEQAAKHTR